MKLKPINDKVLITEQLPEQKTASGRIIIPESAQKTRQRKGIVIDVGQGFRTETGNMNPLHVKKSDMVLFNFATGNEVEIDGKKFQMSREADIVGIIEE